MKRVEEEEEGGGVCCIWKEEWDLQILFLTVLELLLCFVYSCHCLL